jgi:hypothetical protein
MREKYTILLFLTLVYSIRKTHDILIDLNILL